eukprot:GHVU01189232.1.p2 GENE.GHVU01189232.1~~GHVU01189232.1.p2  ORF type:complete len:145 (-),score=3.64 GHVU01189232.1:247-681(-)
MDDPASDLARSVSHTLSIPNKFNCHRLCLSLFLHSHSFHFIAMDGPPTTSVLICACADADARVYMCVYGGRTQRPPQREATDRPSIHPSIYHSIRQPSQPASLADACSHTREQTSSQEEDRHEERTYAYHDDHVPPPAEGEQNE